MCVVTIENMCPFIPIPPSLPASLSPFLTIVAVRPAEGVKVAGALLNLVGGREGGREGGRH